jgi:hypothetical protein
VVGRCGSLWPRGGARRATLKLRPILPAEAQVAAQRSVESERRSNAVRRQLIVGGSPPGAQAACPVPDIAERLLMAACGTLTSTTLQRSHLDSRYRRQPSRGDGRLNIIPRGSDLDT